MKNAIIYRDGVQVIAAPASYADILYGINCAGNTVEQQLVLTQQEARELVAALAWAISEVDAAHGYESFKPRKRLAR